MHETQKMARAMQACARAWWRVLEGTRVTMQYEATVVARGTRPTHWQRAIGMAALVLALSAPGHSHAWQADTGALNAAAERGDAAALSALLPPRHTAQAWPYGDSALRLALASHCMACARVLLDAGAPFPAHDADALGLGYPSWFDLLAGTDPATLRLFVRRGLRLRTRDSQGDSLLHAAAAVGSAEMTRWLVQQKLPLNARDGHGQTPLMVAARYGNLPAAHALLARGAAIGLHDELGQTAKLIAAQAKHVDMVALLQSYGAREYVGTTLPATFDDPGLAGKQQSDATGTFYTQLPFLPAGLRFFAVNELSAATHPSAQGWSTTAPAKPPAYYLVEPPERVVKLDHAVALAVPGLKLRSATEALQFVRVLTATEPNGPLLDPAVAGLALTELPTTTIGNCLSFDARILRRIGARAPQASTRDKDATPAFRIVRFMKPVGWPDFGETLAMPMVYRVVEQVDARGRYAVLERRAIHTPRLELRNVCARR